MGNLETTMDELQQFDYELPRELIAQEPLPNRSDARLMIVDRTSGTIEHAHVRDLPKILRPGDVIVVNDSKVIPARLVGFRASTGGRWEGLYLREDTNGVAEMLSKTRGRLQSGERIILKDIEGREQNSLVVVGFGEGGKVWMRPESLEPWLAILERSGRVPLPPYIRDGQMVDDDRHRYQTVFARSAGSVAAPTAGLHFTSDLLHQVRQAGVALVSVTLHVGLGTFRPIQTKNLAEHRMHEEFGEISESVVKRLSLSKAEGGRTIAIGTTTVRVLETAASQSSEGRLAPWKGTTDLFIRPGYSFQAIDGLMTNFHLPKSSLLVLVSALAGRDLILKAYQQAIRERYRFFSYGDCMLIV